MALANVKYTQALIEAINDVADLVVQANNLAQNYKSKFQSLGISLTDTNLTQAQLNAIVTWVGSLNSLAIDQVVTSARAKQQESHGTVALG